jgi:uncharacterized membrane protein YphA (DoxX/SURF4 family)
MKWLYLICRILLGLMFTVFGLNAFLHFIPMAMPFPDPASPYGAAPSVAHYMTAMYKSGYILHVAALEVIGGLLVLFGGTAPLGLVVLGPILVNILFFHVLLTGGNEIGMGLFATLLEIVLIYGYRSNFAGIFTFKARTV